MTIKFLPHTADIKFQASGPTIEKAFEESAKALRQTITKLKIQEKKEKEISIKAKDKESLLYNFLEEFLFLLDAEDFLLSKIKQIKIKNLSLTATLLGDKASSYKISNDVKAITYNQMFVKKQGDKFICQVVLDV